MLLTVAQRSISLDGCESLVDDISSLVLKVGCYSFESGELSTRVQNMSSEDNGQYSQLQTIF